MRWMPLAVMLASTGCATILAPRHTTVSIGSDPSGAQVVYDGEAVGRTPTGVEASRDRDHFIRLELAGYRSASCQLTSSVGLGWLVADVLLTACVGLVVDALTGAWSYLSADHCYRRLEPEPAPVPQAELRRRSPPMPLPRPGSG